MRRNTAFQGTLNRPGPTPASASHDNPRSFFRDARFFDRPNPIGRNDTTPKDVANTVHVRSSFRYEAQARAVPTKQWGLLRDAGSFDRPRTIRRNAATPGDVANTVHVRRSRGYEAQAQAVTTNQWGLFRDAGSFDRPRPIERNGTTPKGVANAIRVRRSRANEDAPCCGREILRGITHSR